MEEKKKNSEFEQFLKENADSHRLYPSDQVWNTIHAKLHTRKRWLAAGLILLFLTGLTVTNVMLTNPTKTSSKSFTQQKIRIASPDNQHNNYFIATHRYEQPVIEQSLAQLPSLNFSEEAAQKIEKTILANEQKTLVSASQRIKPIGTSSLLEVPPAVMVASEAVPAKTEETKEALVNIRWMEDSYPLSIESVTNSYERQKHSPRFRWQLHFTPTISYRSLKEDEKFITQARMNLSNMPAAATPDLENVITHRPDLGMQLGISGTYPLGKRIDWITGIQFNVSKYDIKAYNYPTEVATIALVNSWGGPTAISTITSFRSNGFMSRAKWLRNYYYSISMPLGFEWRVLGKKHNHWGISATFQPTYVVGNRSYIISMDYQNYAEVPYLIRKWNLNLGFETYAKFNIGKTDFRIGPQIRYQAFSSFKKGYPMQEHLYDMGIKLGMQLGK